MLKHYAEYILYQEYLGFEHLDLLILLNPCDMEDRNGTSTRYQINAKIYIYI